MDLHLRFAELQSQFHRTLAKVPQVDQSHSFRNFLSVAIGSLNEVSTQLEIAYRVGYLDRRKLDGAESRVDECLALTYGLRKSLVEK